VKNLRVPLALAVLCCAAATKLSFAQAQAGAGQGIAIIDLAYIFKNYPRFQAMKDDMKRDVDRVENELKSMRDEIEKLGTRLNEYPKGTPEYKELETHLANRQAELNVKVQLQKKDFLQREAKIYFNVYQEVMDEVKYYAERNHITLVLRFNGDEIDTNDPQDVLKELNKAVVYYNKAIDITPIIRDELLRRQPAAPRGPAPQAMQLPPRSPPAGAPRQR